MFRYAGVSVLLAFAAGMIAHFYPSPTVAVGALVGMVLFQVMSIALVIASLADEGDESASSRHDGNRRDRRVLD